MKNGEPIGCRLRLTRAVRRWAIFGSIVILILGVAAGCGGSGYTAGPGSGQQYAATFCERGQLKADAALGDLIFTGPSGWATALGSGTPMVAHTNDQDGTWHLMHLPASRGHSSNVYALAGSGALDADLWAV